MGVSPTAYALYLRLSRGQAVQKKKFVASLTHLAQDA